MQVYLSPKPICPKSLQSMTEFDICYLFTANNIYSVIIKQLKFTHRQQFVKDCKAGFVSRSARVHFGYEYTLNTQNIDAFYHHKKINTKSISYND